MKFIIQHNLINAQSLEKIRAATTHLPVVWVGAIPFSEEITSNDPIEGTDYIPYGSSLLSRVGAKHGWRGLHYDLTKLNYENFVRNRTDMLNNGVNTVIDVYNFLLDAPADSTWFTRPSLDNKQYAGCVMGTVELREWLMSMMESGPGTYHMAADTKIVLDNPKEISAEWRWFIVGGEIVSGSMYRAHNQMHVREELDKSVIDEAQKMADIWLPCECVVMDTALVDGEMQVVEFNCINSSGFYDHNVKAVFDALYDYHDKVSVK